MMPSRIARAALAAAFTAASVSAPLAAQRACDIEVRKPYQLASAMLYIQAHDRAVEGADKVKNIRLAVKVLTDAPGRIGNPAGRNYVLGQLFVKWFFDGGQRPAVSATRGDLGFSENPDGAFFLPDALDEAFAVVEREMPTCADSTARYRNAVFSRLLNTGINFYNVKSHDSALVYANYALKVSPNSPQAGMAYQVIANSSQATGNLAGAISSLQVAIAKMGNDSASRAGKLTATYNLAILTREHALKQSGEAKTTGLRAAAALFKAYLDAAPDGKDATTARAAYARSLQDAGDTAAVEGIYSDMLANPAKYTALQLFEAGVVQATGKKWDDAAKLYEAGLQMNPYYRDALFNLSNVYFAQRLPDKMGPVVERLRAVDPMNPDVLKLAGAVWQERGRQTTDPSVKKMAQDSVIAYIDRAGKLPARVTVTQFLVGRDGKVTLIGVVENLGGTASSFTVAVELLDKSGTVVAKGETKIDGVGPKSSTEFKPQLSAPTAVAWRYTVR